jgi:hypothetical protein
MDLHDQVEEMNELSNEELNKVIEQLCNSKADEFKQLGYEHVTGVEIWDCVSSKYTKGTPMLHVVVNDILSLKTPKFMNWLTMQAYKGESRL